MKPSWFKVVGVLLGLWAGARAPAQAPQEGAERRVLLGRPQPVYAPAAIPTASQLRQAGHESFASDPGLQRVRYEEMQIPLPPPVNQAAGLAPQAPGLEILPPPAAVPNPGVSLAAPAPVAGPAPTAGPVAFPEGLVPMYGPPGEMCCDTAGVAAPGGLMRGRVYGGAEYLLWWIRDSRLPPLVTTTPANVPQAIQGALTAPGTQVLFGGDSHSNGTFSGGRFTAGVWLDQCATCGLEGTFFFLGRQTSTFQANSDQFPVLGRPIFNLNTGMEDRQLTTTPGLAPGDLVASVGRIRVDTPSQLWGAEANLRHRLIDGCDFRFDVLAGFRYLELREGLHIQENILFTRNATPFTLFNPGNQFVVNDRFDTRNQFYGGQVGAEAVYRYGRWSVDVTGKLALGVNEQTIDIAGNQQLLTAAGAQASFPGGLLAVPSNIGHHTRDRFAVVPEVGVKLGYQVTDWCRATVGYNFLFMNNVVRPGDQIDRVIDVTQVPNFVPPGVVVPPNATGVPRPLVPFRESNFWAQGVSFGLEFRY